MFNKPKDVEGQCNAHIYIGDDYGDSSATFRCQLGKGHPDQHMENFKRGSISWRKDERDYNIYKECPACLGLAYCDEERFTNFKIDEYDACVKCEGRGQIVVGSEIE